MPKRYGDAEVGQFIRGYIAAAIWSSVRDDDEDGVKDTHHLEDVDPETVVTMSIECAGFIVDNINDLLKYVNRLGMASDGSPGWARAGHDFWLTRNGHGVGFWDRGLGKLGDKLSEAAKAAGERHLYVGDDKRIYQE